MEQEHLEPAVFILDLDDSKVDSTAKLTPHGCVSKKSSQAESRQQQAANNIRDGKLPINGLFWIGRRDQPAPAPHTWQSARERGVPNSIQISPQTRPARPAAHHPREHGNLPCQPAGARVSASARSIETTNPPAPTTTPIERSNMFS